MNVVHVIDTLVGGGAQFLVRELNKRLPEKGVQSSALFLTNKHGIKLADNEYCLNTLSVRSPFALYKMHWFLKKFSKANTIVHGHLTYPLYYLAFPGVASGFLKLYTEHSTFNNRRKFPLLNSLENSIYNEYDRIICISESTRFNLLEWIGRKGFEERTKVIHNGARLFTWKASRKKKSNGLRLISVGSLTHRKGFDIALKAVSRLQCPLDRYVIIGQGAEKKRLEKQANALGLSSIVNFIGWSEDVERWLHDSDIMLIPSRWEGFGLVAVEGLSTGLPVVAADVPGLNEVLKNLSAARLVEPENPYAMAEAIASFWSQQEKLDQLSVAARKRAEMYGLDAMAQEYAQTYWEVFYNSKFK